MDITYTDYRFFYLHPGGVPKNFGQKLCRDEAVRDSLTGRQKSRKQFKAWWAAQRGRVLAVERLKDGGKLPDYSDLIE